MNSRLILFSGLITAIMGTVLGMGIEEVSQPQYKTPIYHSVEGKYALAGGLIGFTVGVGQECVRQLKHEQDEERL